MKYRHIPVMLEEVMDYLNPRAGGYYIDCTLGGGGYTAEIAKRVGADGKVLAIDLDGMAIENFRFQISDFGFKENIIIVQDNFRNLSAIVRKNFEDINIRFDGIVLDLGLSSAQLDDRKRGFSFKHDTPIDMAFGSSATQENNKSTKQIINESGQAELERIIKDYGEERFAKNIAKKITEGRKINPIETTNDLLKIIERAVPAVYKRQKIHFATRTFQALRIATNDELKNLEEVLPQSIELLKRGGRLAVISYHSLEDRIVKRFLKKESNKCVCPPYFPICQCFHTAKIKVTTKKALIPGEEEIKINSSSRSAKLRVAEKI